MILALTGKGGLMPQKNTQKANMRESKQVFACNLYSLDGGSINSWNMQIISGIENKFTFLQYNSDLWYRILWY